MFYPRTQNSFLSFSHTLDTHPQTTPILRLHHISDYSQTTPIWRLVSEYSFLLMFEPSGLPPPKGRCCTTPILRLLPDYSQATPILSLLLLIIAYSHIQIIHKLLIFSDIPVLGFLPDYYCQAQVQSPKVKTKRTWADTKITWATTPPTHPNPNF